jgi:alcohol dehydrogenase
VPETTPGTILGHEAVGTIVEVGSAVTTVKAGDRVLVSCISSCGRCRFCKEGHYGLCTGGGGWIFGHLIDGLQAGTPACRSSTRRVQGRRHSPTSRCSSSPTSCRPRTRSACDGRVEPGDTVAVVGAGPIGLAAIMTAQLHSPGRIIAIDLADARLEKAREFGADVTINNGREDAVAKVMDLTGGLGADTAIEAVGVPETFELCTELIRPGGRVANVGVHGHPATLHLEKLWIRDVLITTGLVDTSTTPKLLRLIEEAGSIRRRSRRITSRSVRPRRPTTCSAQLAETHALKVVLSAVAPDHELVAREDQLIRQRRPNPDGRGPLVVLRNTATRSVGAPMAVATQSAMVRRMEALDTLSTQWRSALDAAEDALGAVGDNRQALGFEPGEMQLRVRNLVHERTEAEAPP